MKHNKTPGIDGFPAKFFKIFGGKLKVFVLRALNYCYRQGTLSISMRQSVITCIPKENKPREYLKNWRPILLLTVPDKIISLTIAERVKKVLKKLIARSQTGFIKDRFIAESTRLIYDIMAHTDTENIDGLLMLIDFEKAFDSISWKFMYNTLEFLGFGENFIHWIQLLNRNFMTSILQVGVKSDFSKIERGCKQGDPIAPYLFIICAQILYYLINKNADIKGINIRNKEFRLTQFADDTTLILDGSQSSLQAALNTIEVFGSYSGLKINESKTKLVWIGRFQVEIKHKFKFRVGCFRI